MGSRILTALWSFLLFIYCILFLTGDLVLDYPGDTVSTFVATGPLKRILGGVISMALPLLWNTIFFSSFVLNPTSDKLGDLVKGVWALDGSVYRRLWKTISFLPNVLVSFFLSGFCMALWNLEKSSFCKNRGLPGLSLPLEIRLDICFKEFWECICSISFFCRYFTISSYLLTWSYRQFLSLWISKTATYKSASVFYRTSFCTFDISSLKRTVTSEKFLVHSARLSYLCCKLFHFWIQFLYSALKLSPISLNSVAGLRFLIQSCTYFITESVSI